MALRLDPEVKEKMTALSDTLGPSEEAPVGDVEARRLSGHRMMDHIAATTPPIDGVDVKPLTVPGSGGAALEANWYRSSTAEPPGSAVLYLHGGGMIFSLAEMGKMYDLAARRYVAASAVPMLVIDYRVAPEHPHPTPVEDCYAALEWLSGQADALEFDPNRLAVMGDSAGGGLAAGVCLMARDRGGPAVAAQFLIYPMLDDRNDTPSAIQMAGVGVWDRTANDTGWTALLGDARGGPDVSPLAAPARTTDFTRLPPAFIDVGSAETFRDEDVAYATRIWQAGGQAELHVWPGGYHGFDGFAPHAAVSRDAREARGRWLRRVLVS